jgi:hypothetical protein
MDSKKEINLAPEKLQHNQLITRVYLPLVVICALVLGAGIFVTIKSGNQESISQTWSAIGIIFMIIPAMLLSIFGLTILILAIIGMAKANQALPPHLRSIRNKVIGVNQKAQNITTKTASPVIKTSAILSAVKVFFTSSTWKRG